MNKFKGFFLAFVIFFVSCSLVQAACDTTENNRLRDLAMKVQMSYKEEKEELEPGTYFPPDGLSPEEQEEYVGYRTLFHVYVTNITEDIYVEVKNKNTGATTTYHYSDTDNGKITLKQEIYERNKFTLTVYADGGECNGSKLATHSLETPVFNEFSNYELCINSPEYYMCNRYVDYDLPSFTEFVEKIAKYNEDKEKKKQEDQEKNENKGFLDFIKENKLTISIVAIVIVGAGALTTVIIVKRKRRVV